jgi:glycosyltransferase involved in cell wall biosynthesis
MKVLALPRDPNPYQEQLYVEMRRLGTRVAYLGVLTPSRTLNILLLPVETLVRAAMGWRIIHVHWVVGFALHGSDRFSPLRSVSQAWFMVWLAVAKAARTRIIWTAHNALPHTPVFRDDRRARRALVRASRLVIAHSPATLNALEFLELRPRAAVVIPLGPLSIGAKSACRLPGSSPGSRRFLFFGKILEYKGVEDLIAAATAVASDEQFSLLIAGECRDPALRQRLEQAAAGIPDRVTLDLRHIPDADAERMLDEADAMVLPFRRVTTSSSAYLALTHGRPLIIPRLAAFDHLPDDAVERYDGTVVGLTAALAAMSRTPSERLADMSHAGRAHVAVGWDEIAARTLRAIQQACGSA